jgi:hypothetical protein
VSCSAEFGNPGDTLERCSLKRRGGGRETWVNDQACLTAVLLGGRSGTDNIDFQLSAVLTIATACESVRLDIT